jgi:gamma-glutamylputrescine oxidase
MTQAAPSPYGPTWYAATMVAVPERTALNRDVDVDLCVIGAGLAGLTVAREAARRGWAVAVLEANSVASSASGRNAGFVSPGFAERIDAVVERVGLPRARELWDLSDAGVDYVRKAADGMPGVTLREGKLSVRRIDDAQAVIDHAAMLKVDFGADVEAWPTDQVREVLRSPKYFQAVHFPKAFHIHPLNYALGLAADAEKHGARIFENSPAQSVDPAGVRKRVHTAHGTVRARHVVLAGSTGVAEVDASIAETVVPISTYVAVTAPLGERLFDAVRYTGAVSDTRRAGDYYRIVADDRLLWGGRISARLSTPWLLKAAMRHDMLKVYPQLGDVEIEYTWSGVMAYAVHKMPQIGELAPGYWLASAFGGHGLNTTAMAGEMIARAILDGDDRWRLFSPYELVWAGGRWGRAAAQMVFWSMQARDAVQETIARYRDRARRQAEERQAQWEAEKEARRAAEEARRAEDAARRVAEEEARRLAALEAARLAAERARQAEEEVRLAREEGKRIAEEARRAQEEKERAKEQAARDAAAQKLLDAAQAASALAREIGEYKEFRAPHPVAPVDEPVGAPDAVPEQAVQAEPERPAEPVMEDATEIAAPELSAAPAAPDTPAPAVAPEQAEPERPAEPVMEDATEIAAPDPSAAPAVPDTPAPAAVPEQAEQAEPEQPAEPVMADPTELAAPEPPAARAAPDTPAPAAAPEAQPAPDAKAADVVEPHAPAGAVQPKKKKKKGRKVADALSAAGPAPDGGG